MILGHLLLLLAAALADAEKAYAKRDFEGAARLYREILADHPDDYEARLGLARALDRERLRAEALEAYDACLQLRPGDVAASTGRARVLGREHRYEEALTALEALVAERPEDPQAWWALGDVRLWAGRADASAEAYRRTLGIVPDSAGARIGLGRALARGRKYSEALAELEAVTQKHPQMADAWWAQGDAHFWAGRAHEAVDAYDVCIELEPDDSAPRISRGRALARGREHERARTELRLVTLAAPTDPDGWWALGDVELWAGRYKEAVEAYTTSLDLSPENPDPRIGRARALARDDRFQEAKDDLAFVLERHPTYLDAWWALGDVRLWASEADAAVEAYTKALDLKPDETGPRIGRARPPPRPRRYAEAVGDLDFVLERHPEETDAWRALGDVRLWMGQPKLALEAYDRVLKMSPGEPESYVARARALLALGEAGGARRDLQMARNLAWTLPAIDRLETSFEQPFVHALPWEASVSYETMSFSRDRTNWRTWKERVSRSWTRGSLALEAIQAHRFDLDDAAVAVDAYAPLWARAYANLRFQYDDAPEVLPETDWLIEPFQGFGKGWEGSLFYRHMSFASSEVDLYGGSIAKYLGAWYLRYRLTLVPSQGSTEESHGFTARRYFAGPEDYVEASITEGHSQVNVGPVDVERRLSRSFSAKVSKAFTEHWGGSASFQYQDSQELPVGKGLTLELVARW